MSSDATNYKGWKGNPYLFTQYTPTPPHVVYKQHVFAFCAQALLLLLCHIVVCIDSKQLEIMQGYL